MLGCSVGEGLVTLPAVLNASAVNSFIAQCLDNNGDARYKSFVFDFSRLKEIDTVGIVVLSNLIEYLRRCKVSGRMTGLFPSDGVTILDRVGFFERYNGAPLRTYAYPMHGLLPLYSVDQGSALSFLISTLMPWMAIQLDVHEKSLDVIKICLEEIFFNIQDHSGTGVGCLSAKFDKAKGELHVVVSDFGLGIPALVRTKEGYGSFSDSAAIRVACERGFSTGTNVRNRGWGLFTLIQQVTLINKGIVLIRSGLGAVSAVNESGISKITARPRAGMFPGTLVHVVFKSDQIEDLAEQLIKEDFSW